MAPAMSSCHSWRASSYAATAPGPEASTILSSTPAPRSAKGAVPRFDGTGERGAWTHLRRTEGDQIVAVEGQHGIGHGPGGNQSGHSGNERIEGQADQCGTGDGVSEELPSHLGARAAAQAFRASSWRRQPR